MLRLFSALELPAPARDLLSDLRMPLDGATWVAPEDLHITLQFAGEISRRAADEFAHALADTLLPAPEIAVRGTATFGGKHPTSIYAVVQPTEALDMLQRAHERAARAVGLKLVARKFVPHVTLARCHDADAADVALWLEKTGGLSLPPFWPTRAVLMSARDGGGGPYGVVDEFHFIGGQLDEDDA
jgi:RNA 2',3'-cyclic 3'-phosphodiesterase